MSVLNKATEITNDLENLPEATLWHLFRIGQKPAMPKIEEEPELESESEEEASESNESDEEPVRDWKYPESKCKGSIDQFKDVFMLSFDYKGKKVRDLFRSLTDAKKALLDLNIEAGLIKNRYYYENDYIVYEIVHKGEKYYGKLDRDQEEFLNTHTIYMVPLGYAMTLKKGKHKYVHHIICPAQKGLCVDHKNHDKLDNRSCNLRVCTYRANALNRHAEGKLVPRKGGSFYTITYTNDDGIRRIIEFPIDPSDPNGEAEAKARAIRWREKKLRKSLGIW